MYKTVGKVIKWNDKIKAVVFVLYIPKPKQLFKIQKCAFNQVLKFDLLDLKLTSPK